MKMKRRCAFLFALTMAFSVCGTGCDSGTGNSVTEESYSNALDHSAPVPADSGKLSLKEQSFEAQRLVLKLPSGVKAEENGDRVTVKSDDGEWELIFRQVNTNGWVSELNKSGLSVPEKWREGNPDADDCDVTLNGFEGHVYANNEDKVHDNEDEDKKERAHVELMLNYGDRAVGAWNGLWITLAGQELKAETNIYDILHLDAVRAVLNNFSVIEGDDGVTVDKNGLKVTFPSRWDVHETANGGYAGFRDGDYTGTVYVDNTFASAFENSTGEKVTAGKYEYKCENDYSELDSEANAFSYSMYTHFTDERCIMVKWVLRNTDEEHFKKFLSSNTCAELMNSIELDPDSFELPGEHTDKESGFVCDDNGVLIDYRGDKNDVVIPAKIGDIAITEIKSYLFGQKPVTSVEIQGSPLIREFAFASLKQLKSVKIGEGVTDIGENAFYEDRALVTVELPSTLKKIGAGAFERSALGPVTIGDNVTVGSGAFDSVGSGEFIIGNGAVFEDRAMRLSKFESITIGNDADLSASEIFNNAQAVSISVGEGPETLGEGCFSNTIMCTSLNIPSTVKTIGKNCFFHTEAMILDVPEGVTAIPANCFYGCWDSIIILPESLTEIGAPEVCEDIEAGSEKTIDCRAVYMKNSGVTVPDNSLNCNYLYLEGVYSADQAPSFLGKQSIGAQVYIPMDATAQETVDFDNYLLSIGMSDITWSGTNYPYFDPDYTDFELDPDDKNSLLHYNGDKTEVYIPSVTKFSRIKKIRSGAFKDSKITTLAVPGSVNVIEADAFTGCSSLKDIYFAGVITDVLDSEHICPNSMAGLPDDVTVHLSARLTDAQRADVEKALKGAGLPAGAKFDTYTIE